MTKNFFWSTCHRGEAALQQLIEKQNRLEHLSDLGAKRQKRFKVTCSNCNQTGHNKLTCSEACQACGSKPYNKHLTVRSFQAASRKISYHYNMHHALTVNIITILIAVYTLTYMDNHVNLKHVHVILHYKAAAVKYTKTGKYQSILRYSWRWRLTPSTRTNLNTTT